MNITELVKKYELTQADCWQFKRGGKTLWILTHDACEKISFIEKMELKDIKVINSEREFARFLITMKKDEKQIITVGEASKENCSNSYFGCMAEKRGIDRAVLKLIDAYQYGIYSESESNDFEKK